MEIERRVLIDRTEDSLNRYPVTLLLGPRQCGKTTLAKEIFSRLGGAYFDLEDPETPLKPEIAKLILNDLRAWSSLTNFNANPVCFRSLEYWRIEVLSPRSF